MKQKLNKIFIWIFFILIILQVPIIIYLASIKATAFDSDFYKNEFKIYNPPVNNSLAVTNRLLFYLKTRKADKSYISSFTQKEIAHLIEVKILMHRFFKLLYCSITVLIASILILIILDRREALKRISISAFFGGILTLLLTLIFYLSIRNFDAAFTKFHHIFFRLGNWQFPPEYMLVQLFPPQFWIDIVNRILLTIVITTNIVIVLCILLFGLYLLIGKKYKKFLKGKVDVLYKIKKER